ncbi:hypothetical protein Y032_0361g3462 [Ancylostoma ceylanicum]|uniref:Uncharacterized protein n=1 Tax=Ancylostoma ceylanicum TaxID=53326 RepID=A0A016RVI5_9BILA|nr:hypothetical protein Y032_0361g3462 [Ancylostoma ceylanicum]
MYFLNASFRCQGQPFPLVPGHPNLMPEVTTSYCGSGTITAGEIIKGLPSPACEHRVDTVLEAARILAIWNGAGTLTEKLKWIEDPFHRRVTARSVGLAYAFFRTRCLHVSLMSTTVPQNAMRHA